MEDAVEITRQNFEATFPAVKEAITSCDFLALDCEMTGLFLDDNDHSSLDSMPVRYSKMYSSASKFLVSQFGLSTFHCEAPGQFSAKTYNFNIFPRSFQNFDKRFVCQASSLEFLTQHKFDFNKFIYEGIGYLSLDQQAAMKDDVDRPRKFPQRMPNTADERAFFNDIQAAAKSWHAQKDGPQTLHVAKGAWAGKRALAYSALEQLKLGENDSRGFYVEKVGERAEVALQLTRATAGEIVAHEALVRQNKLDRIDEAAGFSRVLGEIRDARKPVVGHNCLFDLVFVLNIFVGSFPTWKEFKIACEENFPAGVYDTKHIAKAIEARSGQVFERNSLGDLYGALKAGEEEGVAGADADTGSDGDREAGKEGEEDPIEAGRKASRRLLQQASDQGNAMTRFSMPHVRHADGFLRYTSAAGADYAHEAGFDAYMTGCVYAALLTLKRASDALPERTAATDGGLVASVGGPASGTAASGGGGGLSLPSALVAAVGSDDGLLLPKPALPSSHSAKKHATSEDGAQVAASAQAFSLDCVSGCQWRVNMMKTDMPYANVSTSDDPPLSRHDIIVLAPNGNVAVPPRKELFGIIKAVLGRVGRHNGFRLEALQQSGTGLVSQAISLNNMKMDKQYCQKALDTFKSDSALKKIKVLSWKEYEAVANQQEALEELSTAGILQASLSNNCAIM